MRQAIIALMIGLTTMCIAGELNVSFAAGKWSEEDWILVKSPRWAYIGSWIQKEDHIENKVPEGATKDEMQGRRAPETYTCMVHKKRTEGNFTVSSKMDFEYRMAPLIVLAPELGKDANGYPELREHWEVVLYDEGINIWHHEHVDGKPVWHCAAYMKKEYKAGVQYDLVVKVDYTKYGATIVVKCGDSTFAYIEHDLPKGLYVGITGCEGRNGFYDFVLKQ
ncbi:MAG: hypothetical protein ACOX6W_00120 [Lentisphaeria bacterium]|jgi:hypothetical protein|nr:hypothetical protein [Lentisphaerota bacterium]